jgi:hypothetical protein
MVPGGHIARDARRCAGWSVPWVFRYGSRMIVRVPAHRSSLRKALVSELASRPP